MSGDVWRVVLLEAPEEPTDAFLRWYGAPGMNPDDHWDPDYKWACIRDRKVRRCLTKATAEKRARWLREFGCTIRVDEGRIEWPPANQETEA